MVVRSVSSFPTPENHFYDLVLMGEHTANPLLPSRQQTPSCLFSASRNRRRSVFTLAAALATWTGISHAEAQTWSYDRTQPTLRQIISVDATGEVFWPYGREDIAGDGSTFNADEAGTDLRSVYTDADAERLWLRAYVAAKTLPPRGVNFFVFIDTDDNAATGGEALGEDTWPAFAKDPSAGGYERAIGVRVRNANMSPEVLGVWNFANDTWTALTVTDNDVRSEVGADIDPIRIGERTRGFVQLDVIHSLSGLNASCGGNIFVRLFNDVSAERSFGDDDLEVEACRPGRDVYGDPEVIRSAECIEDAHCPNDGICRGGVCLFAYPCDSASDCEANERCADKACVRVVDDTCQEARDCAGLVCVDGACVACAERGDATCADGYACSPNGSCVDTAEAPSGDGDGGDGDSTGDGDAGDDTDAGIGEVKGGAFRCALAPESAGRSILGASLLPLALALFLRRRSKAHTRSSKEKQS